MLFLWKKALLFKPMQVIDTMLVFLSIYLMLLCIEMFGRLQSIDIMSGDNLNPNKNNVSQGKPTN